MLASTFSSGQTTAGDWKDEALSVAGSAGTIARATSTWPAPLCPPKPKNSRAYDMASTRLWLL